VPLSLNLPNRITIGRFLLAIVLFLLMELVCRGRVGFPWYAAFVLYMVTVTSDGLDGYLARSRNQITAFGRIADPFADKVVICGVLILAQDLPATAWAVPAWLVLLVVAREFLVSGLRGYLEGRGTGFAARWEGKTKLVVQAIFCGALLFYPGSRFGWVRFGLEVWLWVTAVVTVWSAIAYVRRATELLRTGADV